MTEESNCPKCGTAGVRDSEGLKIPSGRWVIHFSCPACEHTWDEPKKEET